MRCGAVAAAGIVALVLVVGAARPADAAEGCGERLAWIEARLSRTAPRARTWTWTWGVILGASTVGSLAAVPFVPDEERVDWYVSAFTSAAGFVPLLLMPLEVMEDGPALRTRVRALPGGDEAARCALLADAERFLARDAAGQAAGRAWWNHALNVAVNGGAGLFLGLVYDRWTSGIVTAVVGTGIGEVMIFTQPVDSLRDLREYRLGHAQTAISLTVNPMTQPGAWGLVLAGSF